MHPFCIYWIQLLLIVANLSGNIAHTCIIINLSQDSAPEQNIEIISAMCIFGLFIHSNFRLLVAVVSNEPSWSQKSAPGQNIEIIAVWPHQFQQHNCVLEWLYSPNLYKEALISIIDINFEINASFLHRLSTNITNSSKFEWK